MTTLGYALLLSQLLASSLVLAFGGKSRGLAALLTLLGALASFATAVLLLVRTWSGGAPARLDLFGDLDLAVGTPWRLSWQIDPLTAIVAVAVTLVTLCVQCYGPRYLGAESAHHHTPLRYPAFAATVGLFSTAMLVVIGADDLLVMLVGWEVMGICSYLLIGHHGERDSARRAALQAFLVTRLADVGFVIAVLALSAGAGSSNLAVVTTTQLPAWSVTLATVGLVVAVVGKSGQFPLQGWLPDAMEGPTPVSALIHAATMVAAGVIVLTRVAPLLNNQLPAARPALMLLAVLACVSMLAGGVAALFADDLKRALAWSTVSQIAVMLAAVSLGNEAGLAGALMLLLAHAAFKALLFLTSGAIALRTGTTKLDGIYDLQRRDKTLTVLLGIGLAGLAAVPPFAGFVGKEGILTAAEESLHGSHSNWLTWLVLASLLLTTALTGCYSARLFGAVTRHDLLPMPPVDPSRLPLGLPADLQVPSLSQPTVDEQVPTTPAQPRPAVRRGPAFAAPDRPDNQRDDASDEHETLSFVDNRGHLQDWDLIADLDTTIPSRYTREGRSQRAYDNERARRRREAARRSANPEGTNRLARAVAEQREAHHEPEPRPQQGDEPSLEQGRQPTPAIPAATARPVQVTARVRPQPRPRVVAAPLRPRPEVESLGGQRTPVVMLVPLGLLALVTVFLGVVLFAKPEVLQPLVFGWVTAAIGALIALAGVGLGLLRGSDGHRDLATRFSPKLRAFAAEGYGYHRLQERLVLRPTLALARLIRAGDRDVIDTWTHAPRALPLLGRMVNVARTGRVNDYLAWVAAAPLVMIGLVYLFLRLVNG